VPSFGAQEDGIAGRTMSQSVGSTLRWLGRTWPKMEPRFRRSRAVPPAWTTPEGVHGVEMVVMLPTVRHRTDQGEKDGPPRPGGVQSAETHTGTVVRNFWGGL